MVTGGEARNRYIVFRQMISSDEQRDIVEEVLESHKKFGSVADTEMEWKLAGSRSKNLSLGITCGGDLSDRLRTAVRTARAAFRRASAEWTTTIPDNDDDILRLSSLSDATMTPSLTGVALLYGLNASMPPHYDSPTSAGRKEEWLTMMTIGHSISFRCNQNVLELESGDVLVMDSAAVFHGVERVSSAHAVYPYQDLGLPIPSRLGVLFWQGTVRSEDAATMTCPGWEEEEEEDIASFQLFT